MLKFNYMDLLELDQDTYTAWTPRLQTIEDTAIQQAKQLQKGLPEDSALLERYCQEYVFVIINGETLSPALLNFHEKNLGQFEEALRYGFN